MTLIHLGWTGSQPPQRAIAAADAVRRAAPSCEVIFHADESAVPTAWRDAMDRLGLSPHMRSDVQRHCILREHGGLWLDADVVVTADPAGWTAEWDRYTAIRLGDVGGFVGTDILFVPRGWAGWGLIDAYIESFLHEPPQRYSVLHVASTMIERVARTNGGLFSILPPSGRFPFDRRRFTAASVVARGFDPPADPPTAMPSLAQRTASVVARGFDPASHPLPPRPGLGDMVKSTLSAVGITEERVSRAIGKPCGCGGRAAKLNEWGHKYLGLPPGTKDAT